jgi:hypothetical protein
MQIPSGPASSRRRRLSGPLLSLLPAPVDNAAMEAEPPKRRWYQFSLRSLILFVSVAAVGFLFCARWPVNEKKHATQTTTSRWLIFDVTNNRATVYWATRRPTLGEFLLRVGLFSLIGIAFVTLLRELTKDRHSIVAIAVLCIALSFVFVFVWLETVDYWTGGELGQLFDYGPIPIQDPMLLSVLTRWASVGAIVIFPFTFFALRKRRLVRPAIILLGCVLAEILLVTPRDAGFGLDGSLIAYAAGLILAIKIQPASGAAAHLPSLAPAPRAGG